MTETKSGSRTGGVGILGLFGVLFVGLKLGHVIAWPWLWVLAPFWIMIPLVLIAFVLGVIYAVVFK